MVSSTTDLDGVSLPAVVRPAFTLGGTGGGIARDRVELEELVAHGLATSPIGQVLVERLLEGWQEHELEVMIDTAGNCVVVCSIENLDPMGVHTGDSWTVAPQQTLPDGEFQRLRAGGRAASVRGDVPAEERQDERDERRREEHDASPDPVRALRERHRERRPGLELRRELRWRACGHQQLVHAPQALALVRAHLGADQRLEFRRPAHASSPSSTSASRARPLRVRVLTVPSGMFR